MSIGLGLDRSGEIHGERVFILDASDKSLGMDDSVMGEDDLLLCDKLLPSIRSIDGGLISCLVCLVPDKLSTGGAAIFCFVSSDQCGCNTAECTLKTETKQQVNL